MLNIQGRVLLLRVYWYLLMQSWKCIHTSWRHHDVTPPTTSQSSNLNLSGVVCLSLPKERTMTISLSMTVGTLRATVITVDCANSTLTIFWRMTSSFGVY